MGEVKDYLAPETLDKEKDGTLGQFLGEVYGEEQGLG